MAVEVERQGSLAGVRVLVASINYPPEVTGIAPYTEAIAKAASKAGANVRVVTGFPHFPNRKLWPQYRHRLRSEETIDGLRVSRRGHWVAGRGGLFGRLMQEMTFGAHVLPTVWRSRSDVIVALTPSASSLAASTIARRGSRVGAIVQDLVGNAASQSGTTSSRLGHVIANAEYSLLRKADLVGVITPRFGRIAIGHGVRPELVRNLPNFSHVDTSTATREEALQALGWPTDKFLVVHTGNIGKKQGLGVVAQAARRLESASSDIEFVIVGDGNDRPAVERMASGCGNIRFVGLLSDVEYPLALRAADILLLCERPGVLEMSMPSKLTSYVTAGRPILAAVQAGGITASYVSDHQIAHMVAPGDPAALIDGVESLRRDSERCARLVDAAAELADRLQPSAAVPRYVSFIRELVRSAGGVTSRPGDGCA
jgi:glycosyltransferase involved in cell wall biosynthesis